MIGTYCRSLRLHWIAVLGIALALSPAVRAIPAATFSTTLTKQSSTQPCAASEQLTTALTTLTISVTSSSGTPQGMVLIQDNGDTTTPIASATLNPTGQAIVSLYLSDGPHSLVAVYTANSIDYPSSAVTANISLQCSSPFAIAVSGITPSTSGAMTLTPGDTGTATVTVTPSQEYVASLGTIGSPAFVTVSCSGLPTLASCAFTPQILEIVPGQDAGVSSSMLVQTSSPTVRAVPPAPLRHRSSPVAWAVLLPGMLGLGGLAFGARRRRWLARLSAVLLVGLVATLGAAGCNPQYYYYHYPPTNPTQTPSGTFNVMVTGQSSNGVTATTINTTMVVTVQ